MIEINYPYPNRFLNSFSDENRMMSADPTGCQKNDVMFQKSAKSSDFRPTTAIINYIYNVNISKNGVSIASFVKFLS